MVGCKTLDEYYNTMVAAFMDVMMYRTEEELWNHFDKNDFREYVTLRYEWKKEKETQAAKLLTNPGETV